MASIFMTGSNEGIVVSEEQAQKINSLLDNKAVEWVEMDGEKIRKNTIKRVSFETESQQEYDLTDQSDRYVIHEFERELAGRNFEKYCLDKKYVFDPLTVNGDTVREYEEAKRKWRGLENLMDRRWKAKQYEHQAEMTLAGEKCECREYCKLKTFSEWMAEQGSVKPINKLKKEKVNLPHRQTGVKK